MVAQASLTPQVDWEPDRDSWRLQAACRGYDPNLFFPEKGRPTPGYVYDLCRACPVAEDCLDYAMRWRFLQGIWGGTNEQERRRMRRRSA